MITLDNIYECGNAKPVALLGPSFNLYLCVCAYVCMRTFVRACLCTRACDLRMRVCVCMLM